MRLSPIILVCAALIALTACAPPGTHAAPDASATPSSNKEHTTVRVKVFNETGELVGPVEMTKVVKTEDEWREILTPEQFDIVRSKGTERPFCGTLLDNKKEGVYTCVACGLPLFSSDSKFKSGTGWPSFFQPIARENIAEIRDTSHGMDRVEILCARCDGHLGHVFPDGPRPTGLRYCLNSESLSFTPSSQLNTLADPALKASNEMNETTTSQSPAAKPGEKRTAVFAGGCFWCTEAVFEQLEGVHDVISGYAGGSADTANYEAVSTGLTKHAEVIQITYEPAVISYDELLKLFFTVAHDPTQLNRQGNDVGTQYRSAVFYHNEQEKLAAQAMIDKLEKEGHYKKPIVTTLEPLEAFYPAEKYHQDYARRNPTQGYIQHVAQPKVDKLRQKHADKLKGEPVN